MFRNYCKHFINIKALLGRNVINQTYKHVTKTHYISYFFPPIFPVIVNKTVVTTFNRVWYRFRSRTAFLYLVYAIKDHPIACIFILKKANLRNHTCVEDIFVLTYWLIINVTFISVLLHFCCLLQLQTTVL